MTDIRVDIFTEGLLYNLRRKKFQIFNLLAKIVRTLGDKSLKMLATKTALNFSEPYRRIRPDKFTNYSAHSK